MANTRKPKEQPATRSRKRPTKPRPLPAIKVDWTDLTPERVRQVWEMSHPERPELRHMLERLYRRKY